MDIKLTLKSNNKTLEIAKDTSYGLVDINGIESADYELNMIDNVINDGSTILSKKIKRRPIFFTADYRGSDKESERKNLLSFFNPKKTGTLIVSYLDESRKIEYEIEKFHSKLTNIHDVLSFSVDMMCPKPFFEDEFIKGNEIQTLIGGKSWPFSFPIRFATRGEPIKNVINDGDVDTPIEVIFKGPAVNPKITNKSTGEFIKVKRTLNAGDTLFISTEFGNKKVEIQRASGITENAFNYISIDSTLFQLQVGDNIIEYSTENELEPQSVAIKYRNRYLGV